MVKVMWEGQDGVTLRKLNPHISFENVRTGDVLDVTDEQAKALLRNPDFKKVREKSK